MKLDTVTNAILVAVALAVGATTLHREFRDPELPGPPTNVRPEEVKAEVWKQMAEDGIWLGRRDAPVVIAEFADLECPACRKFHLALLETKRVFGDRVALLFLHHPLDTHRFAGIAALGAECANEQGMLAGFLEVAFAKQDSFGLKPWVSYAYDADLPDTTRFASCMVAESENPRIKRHLALGQQIRVDRTPTLIVNGWRLSTIPRTEQLSSMVSDILSGKPMRSVQ